MPSAIRTHASVTHAQKIFLFVPYKNCSVKFTLKATATCMHIHFDDYEVYYLMYTYISVKSACSIVGTSQAYHPPSCNFFSHTGCSFPSYAPCSYVSFSSLHVEQIWHDNLSHVAGARCSRGVTWGVHFVSAHIACGV